MAEEKELDYSKEKLICSIVVFILMVVYTLTIVSEGKLLIIYVMLHFVNLFISKKMSKWYLNFITGANIILIILVFKFIDYINPYLLCMSFVVLYVANLIYFIVKDKSNCKKLQIVAIILIIPIIISLNYYITKDKLIKDKALENCIKEELQEKGYNGEITLSKLQNIEILSLSNYKGIYNLEGLENLKNLKRLHIHGYTVKNIHVLGYIPNLKKLYISDCDLNYFLKIKSLNSLEELNIEYSKINSDYIIANMPNLKRLYIQGGELKNLEFIKKLNSLEELEFYDCRLESVTGIEDLSNLRKLDFEKINTKDRDSNTRIITELEQLKKVIDKKSYRKENNTAL